jgi:F0F1-type ATP synthase membrane subunit a
MNENIVLYVVGLIIVSLVGYLTKVVVDYLNHKKLVNVADIVVSSVEQLWKDHSGAEKFKIAEGKLVSWLVSRHIKVTDAELQDIIEASVKKMNDVIKANK